MFSIWQKAMDKWQDRQASETIQSSLARMEQKLRDIVFKAQLNHKQISEAQFRKEIEKES